MRAAWRNQEAIGAARIVDREQLFIRPGREAPPFLPHLEHVNPQQTPPVPCAGSRRERKLACGSTTWQALIPPFVHSCGHFIF